MKFMHFDQKKADKVCAALSEGDLLIEYCLSKKDSKQQKKEKRGRPRTLDVFKWLEINDDFATNYKLARTNQAMSMAEKSLVITNEKADNSTDATMLKARSEALRWMSARMDRNTFGENRPVQEPVQVIIKTSLGEGTDEDGDQVVGNRSYKATATLSSDNVVKGGQQ